MVKWVGEMTRSTALKKWPKRLGRMAKMIGLRLVSIDTLECKGGSYIASNLGIHNFSKNHNSKQEPEPSHHPLLKQLIHTALQPIPGIHKMHRRKISRRSARDRARRQQLSFRTSTTTRGKARSGKVSPPVTSYMYI